MDKNGVLRKNTRLPVANNTALARVAKEICWWFPEFYADRQTSPAREPEPLKRSIDGSATKPCPAYRRHILPRSFLRRPYFQWTAGAERGGFDGGHTLMFRQMGREIPIDAARQKGVAAKFKEGVPPADPLKNKPGPQCHHRCHGALPCLQHPLRRNFPVQHQLLLNHFPTLAPPPHDPATSLPGVPGAGLEGG